MLFNGASPVFERSTIFELQLVKNLTFTSTGESSKKGYKLKLYKSMG